MHRRRARRLHRVIIVVLLLRRILSLERLLSRKLLRIVTLLHWHRRIASLVSGRHARRIKSSTGSIILSLRRLARRRDVVARIAAAVEEERGEADETQGCNASNCASRNGAHGSAAAPAAGVGSRCWRSTR